MVAKVARVTLKGLGTPLHRLRDFCHKFPDVVRLIDVSVPDEIGPGQGFRSDLKPRDDVTKLERGNSTDYLAARLKRDRPELLEVTPALRARSWKGRRSPFVAQPPNHERREPSKG